VGSAPCAGAEAGVPKPGFAFRKKKMSPHYSMLEALLLLAPLCAAPPPEPDLELCESRTKQALKQGRENLGEKTFTSGILKCINHARQLIKRIN